MLERKIYQRLLAWKNNKRRECLLVNGARQVGKTFIITEFGKNEYRHLIYINFFATPEYQKIFDGALNAETIYANITAYVPSAILEEHNTLIFLDEIQHCPNARTALKFLALDNKYDVIASGSLLGLNYKKIDSIPVGYEKQIDMYPLDLEEFMWARGHSEQGIGVLRDYFDKRQPVPDELNNIFLRMVREYMVVGGMPDVVNVFCATNSIQKTYEVQQEILREYAWDIQKYANSSEKQKIKDCYDSLPAQLAKENKKFQYSIVGNQGNSRKYANSLEWLEDAGLVRRCYNVSLPEIPLKAYEVKSQFKVYVTDIGLLTAMYGQATQAALFRGDLKGPAKGGIFENLIFDIFLKNDFGLHYYKNAQGTQEIEFVYEDIQGKVIPVEVKARNGATLSMNSFLKKYQPCIAYKIVDGNVGVQDNKFTIPFYMAIFI
ncbi:MAG: ATP-binding protein [Bacillota bacterium]|nr:ATP-binding protein [Bacillota bacterium]